MPGVKKVILLSLALILLIGITSRGTSSYFSDIETLAGNTFTARTSLLWTQTTQENFMAGTPENVIIYEPGNVRLMDSDTGGVTDDYYDFSMIDIIDNLVIVDGQVQLDSSGEDSIMPSRPDGDSSTELTRNIEDRNYKCVDDPVFDDDSTYVYAEAPGTYLRDLYRLGFTPNGNMTRVTIWINARATSDSDTEIAWARPVMESHGPIEGSEIALTTDYALYSESYYVNPNTGNPWTQGDVQSLLVGVDLKSTGGNQARCTQVYVEVAYGVGGFLSPGTLISTNLLDSMSNTSIDSFTYYAPSIPTGTAMTVQFSTDGSTWYNSSGALDGWDMMSEGTQTIDLTGLGYSGPNFYYKIVFTTDNDSYTPVLEYITVNYSTSYLTGKIASQVFDTGSPGASWDTLSWDETLPVSTDIEFKVRAADTLAGGFPDASWIDVGATSPVNSGLPSGRYIQWQATLTTGDPGETPILHEVRVWYNP
jgi:predicted ribosomally synthesized peptide with SipW-like signal peptide